MTRSSRLSEVVAQRLAPGRFAAVHWTAETESTNADLLEVARRGGEEQVHIADYQSAGRGRRDRRWVSPPGVSLMMSVLVRHGVSGDRLFDVTTATGLAALDGLADVGLPNARLKWPNDVVVDGRKLAGMLAEVAMKPSLAIVVGIGLNVATGSIEALPPEIAAQATCIEDHCRIGPTTREDLAVALLSNLAKWLGSERGELMGAYRQRLATIGQDVVVSRADGGSIHGTATGVSERGELIVRDSTDEWVVSVGDVAHVRPN